MIFCIDFLKMDDCKLCKDHNNGELIRLRNGYFVHKLCVNNLESKKSSLTNDLSSLKSKQTEGFLKKLNHFFRGEYLSQELINTEIKILEKKLASLNIVLQQIYDFYWERPPDWVERGYQTILKYNWTCHNCRRPLQRSVVPIHIHHIIPSAKPEGNHKLDNLILLCEICHSKMPGHHLVKENRKRRLKQTKGRRKSQPSRNILGRYLSWE
jgi:hypothetical protein